MLLDKAHSTALPGRAGDFCERLTTPQLRIERKVNIFGKPHNIYMYRLV
jgi:hypothetical protein